MKVSRIVTIFAATVAICLGLASCASDDVLVNGQGDGVDVVKAPVVHAYSGNHNWNVGTRAVENENGELGDNLNVITSTRVTGDFPYPEYKARRIAVADLLNEGKTNVDLVDFDFMYYAEQDLTFTLYFLSSGTARKPNYLGVFYFDKKSNIHKELIWENMNPVVTYDIENNDTITGHVEGIQINIKAGYKFGFYWEGHNGTALCDFYSLSTLNKTIWNKTHTAQYNTQAGTFQINGNTYLGLEDWTDYDYQDWVFFTEVELATVDHDDALPDEDVVEPENPTDPEPEFPEEPETPDTPDRVTGINEVEINLALEDKDSKEKSSHLSLHVRYATDVEVFIPVPAEYYCEADDMEIVMKHDPQMMVHGGPDVTEFDVNGNTVKLIIEYLPEGILVRTEGINQAVIDYCRETFNDGITFEVWNYFNAEISVEKLKEYLNQATVRFIDSVPDAYINAFNETGGVKNPDDCTVSVVDEQTDQFDSGTEGEHLNGSQYNMIYPKK
ncbi:MAG: DUF4114 domain-containing protein [Muribaculaceae bacterium]|nr:DUF4114 domain-containing protein [Muribaculaceae bacterium]